jgi:gluconate 5-dehydrogenase
MFDLSGKVALVTGASRGLGWAMAQSLATAGAHVALNARDEGALARRVAELAAQGLSGEACAFDVTDSNLVQRCVADLAQRHGRLDIVVANAGINHRQPIASFEMADFQRVLDTNLVAVWALCKAAAQQMIPRKQGRLILTGSISAINARPTISAYVASKGAVHALTKQLAVELARDGITVNCVAPGFIQTDMLAGLPAEELMETIPMRRLGRPEEVAALVGFLFSEEAGYITAQVLGIDGGMS